jgi:putative Mg2+ transporter-C (MgtC) family protein
MQTLTTIGFFTRLVVGLGCGALIGVERQWLAHRAGLRTNALVAAGATLFVLYSDVDGSANSTQVAAYVVSGVGFLGGGVILRDGFHVRGLNTAATLWCSAAVGVLAASGHLAFAAVGSVTVLSVHLLGRPLGRLIDREPVTGRRGDAAPPAARHLQAEEPATAAGSDRAGRRPHRRRRAAPADRAPAGPEARGLPP